MNRHEALQAITAAVGRDLADLKARLGRLESDAHVAKRLPITLVRVEKFVSAGKRVLRGIASTDAIDRQGDIVSPLGGSWTLPLPLLWMHDHGSPIGWVREAKASASGIRIECEIAEGIGKSDECWSLLEAGLVAHFSIGFIGEKWEPIPTGRKWTKWTLVEVSAVTVPANPDAKVTHTRDSAPSVKLLPAGAVRLVGAQPASPGIRLVRSKP